MKLTLRYTLPGLLLLALIALLYFGMQDIDRSLPSPLIGLSAPELPPPPPEGQARLMEIDGEPHLVNFWASWCQPCLEEHPVLMRMARDGIPIVGINYKDDPQAAERWLRRHGNPFSVILEDPRGEYAINWGVYGVPETYVIDDAGIIRYKRVGVVDRAFMEDHRPLLLRTANAERSQ